MFIKLAGLNVISRLLLSQLRKNKKKGKGKRRDENIKNKER
jgi:hypothetical protein